MLCKSSSIHSVISVSQSLEFDLVVPVSTGPWRFARSSIHSLPFTLDGIRCDTVAMLRLTLLTDHGIMMRSDRDRNQSCGMCAHVTSLPQPR